MCDLYVCMCMCVYVYVCVCVCVCACVCDVHVLCDEYECVVCVIDMRVCVVCVIDMGVCVVCVMVTQLPTHRACQPLHEAVLVMVLIIRGIIAVTMVTPQTIPLPRGVAFAGQGGERVVRFRRGHGAR